MRALEINELACVTGGDDYAEAIGEAFRVGSEIGEFIYDNMSADLQTTIGGTVDAILSNAGMKEPEDVPIQNTEGTQQ